MIVWLAIRLVVLAVIIDVVARIVPGINRARQFPVAALGQLAGRATAARRPAGEARPPCPGRSRPCLRCAMASG
jgi:hypothetical protein